MLFWILVSIVNADVNEELLTRINRLESANEYLRGQVVSCRTTGPDSISSDLTYNKEKLSSLISEFSTSRDKVYIAEEISYYLQAISEDLKVVNTSTEQITWEEIEATLEALNEKIFRLRAGKQSENFARAYNQIQHKLDEASGNYLNSLKDNAKLLGLIETTKADLASLQTLYELSQITIQSLRADAQAAREQHQERISSISSSLLDSAKVSQDFQLENYSQVQNTENTLISELQKKNIELTLKIEQLNTDLSVFQHSEILQNSTISGLQNELELRTEQLADSQSKFEDFRRQVEMENKEQIGSLQDVVENLQGQIELIEEDRESVLKLLEECEKTSSVVITEDRFKENLIKSLRSDAESTQANLESAQEFRNGEVDLLSQTSDQVRFSLESLQVQYDESLNKLIEKDAKIHELQSELLDCQYRSQRNLRS